MASLVLKNLKFFYMWQICLGLKNIHRKGFEFEYELKPRYIADYTVEVL
jgi:hypothetical protein